MEVLTPRLYGVAVKAKGAGFWTLDQRLFDSHEEAEEWAIQTWNGTGCDTRIVVQEVSE